MLSIEELFFRLERREQLTAFITESNRIEGITDPPTSADVALFDKFIQRRRVNVQHVIDFVAHFQPGARLRDDTSIRGVRVGKYIKPPSGPEIRDRLIHILRQIRDGNLSPFQAHVEYEMLHPFTDGNGRSGRAIWLWHMSMLGHEGKALALGFLQNFYYQTFESHQWKTDTHGAVHAVIP